MSQTKRAYDKFLLYALLIIALGVVGFISATTVIDPSYINTTGPILGSTGTFSGALTGTTLDTGQGANELYDMDQNVLQASAVTFATVNTGHGVNELYSMNQDVESTDAVTFTTINTGQGANELFDMDQNVMTTSTPTFVTVTANNLMMPCTYYITKSGGNALLIDGATLQILATTTSNNAWTWALSNMTGGGKIMFSGLHSMTTDININGTLIGSGFQEHAVTIEGYGRGISTISRTDAGVAIHIFDAAAAILRDFSVKTENGTCIYAEDTGGSVTFGNFARLELTCGTAVADLGWAIEMEASEQCMIDNIFIQSYGEGCVYFSNDGVVYDIGNTEISGTNMWWMYADDSIGLYLRGNPTKAVENIHVSGRVSILAKVGATLGDNFTAVKMVYANHNRLECVKGERVSPMYNLTQSSQNWIDLKLTYSTYLNGGTVFLLTSGSTQNEIAGYMTGSRGTSNVVLVNDAGSTANKPNTFRDFACGSVTSGEWTMVLNDYSQVYGMKGDFNTENVYGVNVFTNYAVPQSVTSYSFEHHLCKTPTLIDVQIREELHDVFWLTSNITHVTFTFTNSTDEEYRFNMRVTMNRQGGW